jgi:hypothetical protein
MHLLKLKGPAYIFTSTKKTIKYYMKFLPYTRCISYRDFSLINPINREYQVYPLISEQ